MRNAKRCNSAFALDLDLPRLNSFESERVGGSMCHGWLFCAALLVVHSQIYEGDLGLTGRKYSFGYFSPVVSDPWLVKSG